MKKNLEIDFVEQQWKIYVGQRSLLILGETTWMVIYPSCDLFVWRSKIRIRHIGYTKTWYTSFTKHININISTQGDLSLTNWVYSFRTIINILWTSLFLGTVAFFWVSWIIYGHEKEHSFSSTLHTCFILGFRSFLHIFFCLP